MNTAKLEKLVLVLILMIGVLGLFSLIKSEKTEGIFGSVSVSNEYNFVSTGIDPTLNVISSETTLRNSYSTVGSVTITGANTSPIFLYNATTSDASLRALATSSLEVITIPPSASAGTYVFDAVFNDGLIVSFGAGLVPTTTITYR